MSPFTTTAQALWPGLCPFLLAFGKLRLRLDGRESECSLVWSSPLGGRFRHNEALAGFARMTQRVSAWATVWTTMGIKPHYKVPGTTDLSNKRFNFF